MDKAEYVTHRSYRGFVLHIYTDPQKKVEVFHNGVRVSTFSSAYSAIVYIDEYLQP